MSQESHVVLDQLKKVQEIENKIIARQVLSKIKNLSREVLEAKYQVECLIELLNVSDKEKKAIIDWINNLSSVQLSEDDKKELKDGIKEEDRKDRTKMKDKIEKNTVFDMSTLALTGANNLLGTGSFYATNAVGVPLNTSSVTHTNSNGVINCSLGNVVEMENGVLEVH